LLIADNLVLNLDHLSGIIIAIWIINHKWWWFSWCIRVWINMDLIFT